MVTYTSLRTKKDINGLRPYESIVQIEILGLEVNEPAVFEGEVDGGLGFIYEIDNEIYSVRIREDTEFDVVNGALVLRQRYGRARYFYDKKKERDDKDNKRFLESKLVIDGLLKEVLLKMEEIE